MLLARPEFRGTMSDRRFGVPQRGSAGWVSEASQGPRRPALPVKTLKDSAMITCQRCQTENLDGSQYCDECGAALGGQPQAAARTPADEGHAAPATAPSEGSAFEAPAPEPRRRATVETPSITNAQPLASASVLSQTPAAPPRKAEES